MANSYKEFLQDYGCKNLKELKSKLGKDDDMEIYAEYCEEQRRRLAQYECLCFWNINLGTNRHHHNFNNLGYERMKNNNGLGDKFVENFYTIVSIIVIASMILEWNEMFKAASF